MQKYSLQVKNRIAGMNGQTGGGIGCLQALIRGRGSDRGIEGVLKVTNIESRIQLFNENRLIAPVLSASRFSLSFALLRSPKLWPLKSEGELTE